MHVLMRDEKEGRKKQARSNKQQGKATQHTQGSHINMLSSMLHCLYLARDSIQVSCLGGSVAQSVEHRTLVQIPSKATQFSSIILCFASDVCM